MKSKATKAPKIKVIADNRQARFHYELGDSLEAGIALAGSEVKSLRHGRVNLTETYAAPDNNELWLFNLHIPEYDAANRFNHNPRRPRKLLLHRREINRLMAAVQRGGMTIVPLKLYFNAKGKVKIELASARGKKLHDKRETEKKRDWTRQKQRLMKQYS